MALRGRAIPLRRRISRSESGVAGLGGADEPLTFMSEYPTLYVVKSDIPATGAIAPPKRKASRSDSPATPLADVLTRSAAELERDLTELLREARPTCMTTEVAADGSPKVASLVSVWLLSQVGKAVGRPKLLNLSKVGREELRSIGGVARLAHRTLHPLPVAKAS